MMSVIRMYVFLFELFIVAICLLFFKEFEVFVSLHFGYGEKVMYSIIGSTFSHAFYLALKMISGNLKTEYSSLKTSFGSFITSTEERFFTLETRADNNDLCIENLGVEYKDIKTELGTITKSIGNINKHLERKRTIEVAKKEFKQELDVIWREYCETFDKDLEIKEFAAMLYRKLADFVVEKQKYDFTDIDFEAFTNSHQSVLCEIQRISKTFAISNIFIESFFTFIKTINKKYYADCVKNFDSKLNSKRKKFETDTSRYMLNVLDCIQLVWIDFKKNQKEINKRNMSMKPAKEL